jgi:HlyD family secretion protein
MKKKRRFALFVIVALAMGILLVAAFRPAATSVDLAMAKVGPLQESVEQEAKTRMHDRYILAARVAGRLQRIELHAGDKVHTGQIVGWLAPVPLSGVEAAELSARLRAAQAAAEEAAARVEHASAALQQANADFSRASKLHEQGVIAQETFEKAQTAATSAGHELDAAKERQRAALFQVAEVKAALTAERGTTETKELLPIRSPVRGRVLRLVEQSERVLQAGTPVLEIGSTPRLELVADFLSTDAVRIRPGMPVSIDDWGGDPLRGNVRLVEPSGFTKVSALGVEEQRVNVIVDFVDPPNQLGDNFRAIARVITWENPGVLKIPIGALFRVGEKWSVFTYLDGRVHRTAVTVGHRSATEAEILTGLQPGEAVVSHPPNELADGARATPQ